METMGVIAGNRQLPVTLARNLKQEGYRVVMTAHVGETVEEVEDHVDALEWVKIGQIGRILKFFQTNDVVEVCVVGGINKGVMFSRIRPDRHALKVLGKLRGKGDDTLLRAFAGVLEDAGFSVVNPLVYLQEMLAPPGCLTKRRPKNREKKDIEFGANVLQEIGPLDIGQGVAVKEGVVLAIEAIEGTDEMILRGGSLGRRDVVIVKMAKPNQDLRFDQPAVGLDTIKNMRAVKASVLAIESGKTIIFDKEDVIKEAESAGVSIVAI